VYTYSSTWRTTQVVKYAEELQGPVLLYDKNTLELQICYKRMTKIIFTVWIKGDSLHIYK